MEDQKEKNIDGAEEASPGISEPGEPAIFDIARPISIKLQTPQGTKAITIRFPTDEEWIQRARTRKIIIKQLGRGTSETIVPDSSDADADLLRAIRLGEDPEIDGYEATQILDQISQADVDDVLPGAGFYTIDLRVVGGGIVTHQLGTPSAKDMLQFRRSFARILDLPFNKQSLTINLGAARDLYDRLAIEPLGYAGAVPIIHKVAAVKAAMDAVEAGVGAGEPENF